MPLRASLPNTVTLGWAHPIFLSVCSIAHSRQHHNPHQGQTGCDHEIGAQHRKSHGAQAASVSQLPIPSRNPRQRLPSSIGIASATSMHPSKIKSLLVRTVSSIGGLARRGTIRLTWLSPVRSPQLRAARCEPRSSRQRSRDRFATQSAIHAQACSGAPEAIGRAAACAMCGAHLVRFRC